MPRLARLASTQSVPSSDVIAMVEGGQTMNALHNHIVALHQWVHPNEESRQSLISASPLCVDMAHTPSSC